MCRIRISSIIVGDTIDKHGVPPIIDDFSILDFLRPDARIDVKHKHTILRESRNVNSSPSQTKVSFIKDVSDPVEGGGAGELIPCQSINEAFLPHTWPWVLTLTFTGARTAADIRGRRGVIPEFIHSSDGLFLSTGRSTSPRLQRNRKSRIASGIPTWIPRCFSCPWSRPPAVQFLGVVPGERPEVQGFPGPHSADGVPRHVCRSTDDQQQWHVAKSCWQWLYSCIRRQKYEHFITKRPIQGYCCKAVHIMLLAVNAFIWIRVRAILFSYCLPIVLRFLSLTVFFKPWFKMKATGIYRNSLLSITHACSKYVLIKLPTLALN